MRRLLVALLLLLTLSGCAREQPSVSSMALDRNGALFCLTLETIQQSAPDSELSAAQRTVTGRTAEELLHALPEVFGAKPALSEAQVLLVSPAAVPLLLPLCRVLCREGNARLSLRVALVRKGRASDLLAAEMPLEIAQLLDCAAEAGTLPDLPLYSLTEPLLSGHTVQLPALILSTDGAPQPDGTAKLSLSISGEAFSDAQ